MCRKLSLTVSLLVGLSSLAGRAAEPAASPGEAIVLRHCALAYRDSTNVGASTDTATLQDCLVELGDRVRAGQVLGRLQDSEEKAKVEAAQARYALATARYRRGESLASSKGTISRDELDVLRGQMEEDRTLLEAARAALRVREIVSPHDGVVVSLYRAKGEGVSHDPVFRVVNPEVVWATGALDIPDIWRVKPGQTVRLWVEFAGADMPVKREMFEGSVVFVNSEIDAKTQTCKVVAEVKNRANLLKSGLEARMEIYPDLATKK
jgi:RND family efflux transporter MFP subunit